jgi:hydroxymethylbilane synthase
MRLAVAARDSNLSQAQVKEFEKLLKNLDESIQVQPIFLKSYGDLDYSLSLRTCAKDDLFTKEIDQVVLDYKADVSLHSAKDLPSILDEQLEVYYFSNCLDNRDSIVFRSGFTLETIPTNGVILASSERREKAVLELRNDLVCQDVRGTIEKRLQRLQEPNVYGVVVAEAAIIRLGLTDLSRLILEGPTHPKQGQLAVVGLKKNYKIKQLIQQLNA